MSGRAKPGQRVRITIEGVTRNGMTAPRPGGAFGINLDDRVTFEVLADLEPEWVAGDVVRHVGDGTVLVRTTAGTWASSISFAFPAVDVSRWWRRGELERVTS